MQLTARWIVPISSPPIENGIITVEDGKIVSVETSRSPVQEIILLPGLVNAHAHLEFSTSPSNAPFEKGGPGGFTNWAREMATSKKSERSIVRKFILGGTTTVADHCHPDSHPAAGPLRRLPFWEVLGADKTRSQASLNKARERAKEEGGFVTPHSLYGVHREVLEEMKNEAWSLHLLESSEEDQFFRTGQGPLADYVKEKGGEIPFSNTSPIQWLSRHLHPTLLVHCNYLTDEEIGLLPALKAGVIHCPGSHQFFGHKKFPLEALKKQGVIIGLGTDSLASNDEVSMFREMRLLKQNFPSLSPEEILKMATINGASALGLSSEIGTLEGGKQADVIGIKITDEHAGPYENILKANEVSFSMIGGKPCIAL